MNRIYEPHKSSILDLDANVVSLVLYLVPFISNMLTGLGMLVWALPLAAFILEKNSPLVKFHAAQALTIHVIMAVINLIVSVFTLFSAGFNLLIGINIFAIFGSVGIFGLLYAALTLGTAVLEIIGMVQSWKWISYRLPIVGSIADIFVKE